MSLPNPLTSFLAALDLPAELQGGGHPSSRMPSLYITDIMLVVGGGVLILVCLVAWAIFIRKPKGDDTTRSYIGSRSSRKGGDEGDDDEGSDDSGRRRKRRKRRRRDHRGKNPTLAQTGGLPPVRKPGEFNPGAGL